jgi:hypothetical protein
LDRFTCRPATWFVPVDSTFLTTAHLYWRSQNEQLFHANVAVGKPQSCYLHCGIRLNRGWFWLRSCWPSPGQPCDLLIPMNDSPQRCECPLSGFCERHQVEKSARLHELCGDLSRPGYWSAWEAGYGPGQRGSGLGDTVAKAIRVVTRGKVKPCGGCEGRRESLNRIAPSRD